MSLYDSIYGTNSTTNEMSYTSADPSIVYPDAGLTNVLGTVYLPRIYGKDLSYLEVGSSGKIAVTLTDIHSFDISNESGVVHFNAQNNEAFAFVPKDTLKTTSLGEFTTFSAADQYQDLTTTEVNGFRFKKKANFSQPVIAASTLNVQGPADLDSSLNVDGSSGFVGAVGMSNSLHVVGPADLDSTLHVIGTSGLVGAVGMSNSLHVVGPTDLDSTLHVIGTSGLVGDVGMSNKLHVVGTTDLDNTLHVVGATDLDSTLNVDGSSGFVGAVGMSNSLHVVGPTDLDSTLHR